MQSTGRSGKRVIFSTLDDGTGLVDLAFFDDSHDACAHTVFHSWLLLVRGVVQRRGPRSLSVVGSAAWNLADLLEVRREEGLEGVAARLAGPAGSRSSGDDGDGPARRRLAGSDGRPAPAGSAARDPREDRTIRMPTGYEMHPWADLRPAGEGPAVGRKLWHQSPGSAG